MPYTSHIDPFGRLMIDPVERAQLCTYHRATHGLPPSLAGDIQ